jgi:two-component system LytT family response regulator
MALTCIVVDDEEISIDHLLGYIAKVPFLNLQGSFTNPAQAITFLENNPVELVFLDIEMPNFAIDGLDFIKISGNKYNYILTTAYPKYALPSYDYDVVDFLCKPFPFDRFLKAVNKVRTLNGVSSEEPDSEDHTYVRVDGKHQRIDFTEILWIESERQYVSIYTLSDRINLHLSISEIEASLPSKLFVRVHKSYIVAKKKIDLVDKEHLAIKKESQTKLIPIGESYRKSLMRTLFPNRKK